MRAGPLLLLILICYPAVGAIGAEVSEPLPSIRGVNLLRADAEELYLPASFADPWFLLGTSDDPTAAFALREKRLRAAKEKFEQVLALAPGDIPSQERIVAIARLLEEQAGMEELAQRRRDRQASPANSRSKADPVCTAACETWKAAAKRRIQNGDRQLWFSGLPVNAELNSIYYDAIEADLGVEVHYTGCVAASYGNPYYQAELEAYLRDKHGSDIFDRLWQKAIEEHIRRLKATALIADRAARVAGELLTHTPAADEERVPSVRGDGGSDMNAASEEAEGPAKKFVSGITWGGLLALLQSAL